MEINLKIGTTKIKKGTAKDEDALVKTTFNKAIYMWLFASYKK